MPNPSIPKSPYYERLSDALHTAVADNRIGVPRFIRWLDHLAPGADPEDARAVALEVCTRVFGSNPKHSDAAGASLGQAVLLARWTSGASALITAGPASNTEVAGPEIMLLGSAGAIYFDGPRGGSATVDQVGRS
jgi:hypothetical protein